MLGLELSCFGGIHCHLAPNWGVPRNSSAEGQESSVEADDPWNQKPCRLMRFGLGPATWFDGDYGKLWTWTTLMETNINQPTGSVCFWCCLLFLPHSAWCKNEKQAKIWCLNYPSLTTRYLILMSRVSCGNAELFRPRLCWIVRSDHVCCGDMFTKATR